MNRFDSLGVLHRKRGDCRNSITAVGRERFQIRHHARAAARIESGDGQKNGRNGNSLRVEMAHDWLSRASFREENSRSRFVGAEFSWLAPENARHLRMYAH